MITSVISRMAVMVNKLRPITNKAMQKDKYGQSKVQG